MAIYIVCFPMKNGEFVHSYVKLTEGTSDLMLVTWYLGALSVVHGGSAGTRYFQLELRCSPIIPQIISPVDGMNPSPCSTLVRCPWWPGGKYQNPDVLLVVISRLFHGYFSILWAKRSKFGR